MKNRYAITLAVVGVAACVAVFAVNTFQPQSVSLFSVETEFINYLTTYGKSYGTKEEYQFRLEQFAKQLE